MKTKRNQISGYPVPYELNEELTISTPGSQMLKLTREKTHVRPIKIIHDTIVLVHPKQGFQIIHESAWNYSHPIGPHLNNIIMSSINNRSNSQLRFRSGLLSGVVNIRHTTSDRIIQVPYQDSRPTRVEWLTHDHDINNQVPKWWTHNINTRIPNVQTKQKEDQLLHPTRENAL